MSETKNSINNDDVFTYADHVAFRKIAGKVVIVQPLEEKMLTLNESGTAIWEMLDGISVKNIALALMDEFEVDEPSAVIDVTEFLHDMLSRGLIARLV